MNANTNTIEPVRIIVGTWGVVPVVTESDNEEDLCICYDGVTNPECTEHDCCLKCEGAGTVFNSEAWLCRPCQAVIDDALDAQAVIDDKEGVKDGSIYNPNHPLNYSTRLEGAVADPDAECYCTVCLKTIIMDDGFINCESVWEDEEGDVNCINLCYECHELNIYNLEAKGFGHDADEECDGCGEGGECYGFYQRAICLKCSTPNQVARYIKWVQGGCSEAEAEAN